NGRRVCSGVVLAFLVLVGLGAREPALAVCPPIFRTLDLDLGQTAHFEFSHGRTVQLRLISIDVTTDPIRGAVRSAKVKVEIDGKPITLNSGNYGLPRTLGPIQIDCPVVSAYRKNTTDDHWALEKAARLRVWPAGSPWIEPDSFVSPVRQRWFASLTQM